jgi:cell division protein FtsB
MNCSDFRKSLGDYMDGSICESLNDEMKMHMDNCPSCRIEYEETKKVTDTMRGDASSTLIPEKYRKGLKETILKAPARKPRTVPHVLKNLMYAALIFLIVSAGIYYVRGVKVNIEPSGNIDPAKSQVEALTAENQRLKNENNALSRDNDALKQDIEGLKVSLKEMERETDIYDWIMVNSRLGEAIIEGNVINVDRENKIVRLEIFKDDNTPDINPNITIPDGIFITRPLGSGEDKYDTRPGTIDDIKVGDHISIHYMGNTKSARAVLYWE